MSAVTDQKGDGELDENEVLNMDFSQLAIDYAFQGLDTSKMKILLYKFYKEWKSPRNFTSDMCSLVTLFMTRGTAVVKSMEKMSEEGVKRAKELRQVYHVYVRTKANANDPLKNDTVTLARVAACYPKVCVKIVLAGLHRDVAPSGAGPQTMHWTQFPCIIPKDASYDSMFNLWNRWANSADVVLNGVDSDSDKVYRYGEITRNNSKLSDAERIELLNSLGITFDSLHSDKSLGPVAPVK